MAEFWDVTDEDGVPTGETCRRGSGDLPAGQFHVVAATCVVRRDGAVLLTQRAADKDFALTWEFPGGSALAGEESASAAVRELREETGLEVPAPPTLVGRFVETSALVDLYVTPAPARPVIVLDATEVAASDWVSLSEVEQRDRSGRMAAPWGPRLEAFWKPLAEAVEAARRSQSVATDEGLKRT